MATFALKQSEVDNVLNVLKKRGNATSFDLSEATGINRDRVKFIMQKAIIPVYPDNAFSKPAQGYFWKDEETSKPERYPENRNDEGYLDPTAAKAIKNASMDDYIPGEIWVVNDYGGSEEKLVLVIASDSKSKSVTCLNVNPIDQWFNEWSDQAITVKGKHFYVRPCRLATRPSRTMKRSRETLPMKEFEQIKMKLGLYLGIQQVEVEKIVEKEVKVEVPVEVEKIVEKTVQVPVDTSSDKIAELEQALVDADTDLELANQRAEIWERAFMAVTCGKERA